MKDSSQGESTPFTWEDSLKTAIHVGVSLSEWEEMTPYELMLICEVFMEQKEIREKEQISLVWLGEYYHRLKKLPNLKEILKDLEPRKEMTEQEMLAVVRQINSQLGGKDETKKV